MPEDHPAKPGQQEKGKNGQIKRGERQIHLRPCDHIINNRSLSGENMCNTDK